MFILLSFKILLILIPYKVVTSGYGINYTAFCALENKSSLLDVDPLFSQIRTTIPLNFRKPSNVSQFKDGTIEWFYGHVRLLEKKGKVIYTLHPDHRFDLGLARRYLSVSYYLELEPSLLESLNEICLSTGTDLFYGSYTKSKDELCLLYRYSTLYNITRLKKVTFKQDQNELLLFEEYGDFIMKRSIYPYKGMFLIKLITFPPRNQSLYLRVHMTQCREKVLNANEEISLLYNKEIYIHVGDICEFVNSSGSYNLRTTHSNYLEKVPLFPIVLNGSYIKYIDIAITSHLNHTCEPIEEIVDLFAYPEHLIISNIGYWQNFTLEMQMPFHVETDQGATFEKCILYLISSISGKMTRMVQNINGTFKFSQYPGGFIIYSESILDGEIFLPEMCLTRMRCQKRFISPDCFLRTSPLANIKLWKKLLC